MSVGRGDPAQGIATAELGGWPEEAELARLIKRAAAGHSWCSTRPLTIARYLLAHGVRLEERRSDDE